MSRLNPIVIHDSDSDAELPAESDFVVAADSVASSARSPTSVADLATASVADSAPLTASASVADSASLNPSASLASVTLIRSFLFDSDTETETESECMFKTPPPNKSVTATWQDKPNEKMGEDVGRYNSPPYDPFGPSLTDNETATQVEEDRNYAAYLDMELNGHSAKHEANKRLKIGAQDSTDEEKPRKKQKDRSLYWQQRYATQKAKRMSNVSLHFVRTYFCGVDNFSRTTKKGPCGTLFKRAIIPGSNGTVQHDIVISSDRVFFKIVGEQPTLLLPDENGKIQVRDNCIPDTDLLFSATFPETVFPFSTV